ncbi:MAG: radical SAM protein [Marinospirillum sp.]|uniref:radical SAM protein n=1 Tax=Marinospirillum sp. TaxID=2183934 RepID=UPI0019E4EE1B|nr:radical SAM protein [Marinospirillum sp.]MBE0508759.1 radical SAM protein [Marinospirillum sp.]
MDGTNAYVNITHLDATDPLPHLVGLEKQLGEQGVKQLQLEFTSSLPPPFDRLEKLGFQQSASSTQTYQKQVHYQRAVRFSITEKCNYACFFCHEEGMEMTKKRQEAEMDALFNAIRQFAVLDFQDFTFTGGEPLLNPRKIFACLDFMESINYLPEITFVSNGLAITDKLLSRLKTYPGKIRFNISMHSLEETAYNRIVQDIQKPDKPLKHDEYNHVKSNLEKLHSANIPFKLNIVLLKDLNTSDEAIQAMIDYALNLGATRLKFLELLLTPELNHLYGYFYRLQALKDRLADRLSLVERSFKRDVYRFADTPLLLEFQECTCARGCNTCPVNRAANFTAELKLFPCFLHPEDDYDLTQMPLSEALKLGEQKIQKMADYFGDNSPIIIRDHYLTQQETFFYYYAPSDVITELKRRWSLDTRLERRRDFEEHYLSQRSLAGEDFSQIHKLTLNSYDQHALEIEQSHQVCQKGSGQIITHFHCDGRKVQDMEKQLEQLKQQGLSPLLSLNWTIHFYRESAEREVEAPQELSISFNPESGLYFLRSSEPLQHESLDLRPLDRPLPLFVSQRLRLL